MLNVLGVNINCTVICLYDYLSVICQLGSCRSLFTEDIIPEVFFSE